MPIFNQNGATEIPGTAAELAFMTAGTGGELKNCTPEQLGEAIARDGYGVPHVDTLQDLRDSTSTAEIIYVRAHTTAGDGGHGNFRLVTGVAPGTYADNNGTIVVTTGGDGSSAWLRVYSGAVNTLWFGADFGNTVSSFGASSGQISVSSSIYLTDNVTVPANIDLEFISGGIINLEGYTLTINGGLKAGLWQIFTGSGTVDGTPNIIDALPEWWGAVGDNVEEDAIPCNKSIAFVIQSNIAGGRCSTVTFSKQYVIESPLLAFTHDGAAFGYFSIALKGVRGYVNAKGTSIRPNYIDRPALIIQKGRNVLVEGLDFYGANIVTGADDYTQLLDDTIWTSYGARNDRYSPYAGISIDPFSNGVPAGGGYPTLSGYYTSNSGGTSGVVVKDCNIRNFLVGVALSTSNGTQLGDSIKIVDTNLSSNMVPLAVGQGQNRNITLDNVHVNYCNTFVDTTSYGVGNGPGPNVKGGLVTHCKWLMNSTASWGQISWSDFYAESLWSMGTFGASSGGFTCVFKNCHIKLISAVDDNLPSIDHQLYASGKVVFVGGYLGFYRNAVRRVSLKNEQIVFEGTVLDGPPVLKDINKVKYIDVQFRYGATGGTGLAEFYANRALTTVGVENVYISDGGVFSETRYTYKNEGSNFLSLGTVDVVNNGDGTATITDATVAGYSVVGDYYVTLTSASFPNTTLPAGAVGADGRSLSIGMVSSIVGSVVTLSGVPQSFVGGAGTTLYLSVPAKAKPITVATFTSGVATATVSNASAWKVGDIVKSSSITNFTRIVSIVGTTITFAHNATANGIAPMYDANWKLIAGQHTAAPTAGHWWKGFFVRNAAPAKDANNMILMGWVCTVAGEPGTWEPVYMSAVTPAT